VDAQGSYAPRLRESHAGREGFGRREFGNASLLGRKPLLRARYDWRSPHGRRAEFLPDRVADFALGCGVRTVRVMLYPVAEDSSAW
jgi:hypothetical protein